jgi:hypothetical protein
MWSRPHCRRSRAREPAGSGLIGLVFTEPLSNRDQDTGVTTRHPRWKERASKKPP